ncbi:cupin domain-containing protein [Achromobacter aegrifaciens]|uniref:cupin domain-containing protein n=1 Tax=Achromobacter aegrifaciens TaxID=1287736 RepID=UPI000F74027F|nr:cupin domain-containing protein [Achromobacter aegrifaciens]RSF00451.1 anti-sigma factor [Achromobacter aegrifaciens]
MLINADFSRNAIVTPEQYQWVPSPQHGVERMMLDRVGGEQARATSIVRYAPDSRFPPHAHPGGEEILVLSGTFSDASGDYPAGWYLRNPPGSAHAPSSRNGATILVKLGQMPADEQSVVRIDTRDPAAWTRERGGKICPLYSASYEQTCLRRLPAHAPLPRTAAVDAEILVLAGSIADGQASYPQGSWLRLARGAQAALDAGAAGATVYLKTNHLPDPNGGSQP